MERSKSKSINKITECEDKKKAQKAFVWNLTFLLYSINLTIISYSKQNTGFNNASCTLIIWLSTENYYWSVYICILLRKL